MLPSEPHLNGKRRADDTNILLNAAAAKRAKKEMLSSQPQLLRKRKSDDSNPLLTAALAKRAKKDAKAAFRLRSVAFASTNDDSEVEQDIRAMEDEADHLRRNSRAHTTIESPLLSTNPAFQFGSHDESSNTSRSRGKMKVTDISTPLPENETPQIKRNKQLREGAMAGISNGRAQTPDVNGNDTRHRRKSSVGGRGKRISSSFEATGILYQPHNSVSDGSFYKHIDVDLPESERIRQLLIWSSLRAAATPTSSTSKPSSSQPSLPLPPPLPPLSAQAVQVLKSVQDDIVKMLAEKTIDLSLYSSEAGSSSKTKLEDLLENEQNVRNRQWEVTYSDYIKKADAENEAWKEVGFKYKAYGDKLQSFLQDRTTSTSTPAVTRRPETRNIDEIEAELDKRLGSTLEFKIDQISSFVSAARVTTYIAEKALNERFDIIASNLKSRLKPHPHQSTGGPSAESSSGSGSSTQILTTYITNPRSKSTSSGAEGSMADPLDLMRSLTRVDKERPPGMIGDAVWRAAREVQRVGESGVGAVGERRLTGVPVTPRKTPGTPRRGSTPGRDR